MGDPLLDVGGRELRLRNAGKVLYPATGFTKGEVVDYYRRVAPVLVAHLRDRPVTLKRYPDGVEAEFFYEKQCPSYAPDWLPTIDVPSGRHGTIRYCTVRHDADVVWLATMAALELHPLLARAPRLDSPDQVVFDLDPGPPAGILDAAKVALLLREALDGVGLACLAKSSGSKGVHVIVPLDGSATYDATKPFARGVAQVLERHWPELVVSSMRKQLRAGKVLVDWSQNDAHKSTVAPYSLRARARPTVAAPLRWDEVERAVEAGDEGALLPEAADVVARLESDGDLLAEALDAAQSLPGVAAGGRRADALGKYRSMRDFSRTPEPAGEAPSGSRGRFVIQEHDATRLHWDLRLEREGVLASWALPRGVPWAPKDNRLAVHTEDHPVEYLEFSGDIPGGTYGAGRMTIWDRGTYEEEIFEERKVQVVLHGERVQGRYALFPIDGRDWLIHRMDPPQDPSREPLPQDLLPMRAVPGPLPEDEAAHSYEIRWAGRRVIVASSGGQATFRAGGTDDVSDRVPELRRIGRALGHAEVVVDGVIVSVAPGGRPLADGADTVAARLGAADDRAVRRLAKRHPLALVLFDVLFHEGRSTCALPYEERRGLLESLGLAAEAWQTPAAHTGDGAALLDAAAAQGLPGLVAKRLGSTYEPGAESPSWVEVAATPLPATNVR